MKKSREIEIKLRIENAAALAAKLEELGARRIRRVFEQDTLFESYDHGFRKLQAILRLRQETPVELHEARGKGTRRARKPIGGILTFKGLVDGPSAAGAKYKEREEIEYRIDDVGRFACVLRGIGMQPWFRYEKYRTECRCRRFPMLKFDVDETPIGTFLELEGPRRQIDRAASELGYSKAEYIATSYLELFAKECARRGVKARNMTFRAFTSKKFR